MKQKVTLMLLATFLCCVLGVQAQTGSQVTGKVVDAMGELPGVSVVVKGTTNGTITALDGSFKLDNVKSSDILQFSFVGYKTQEIKVGSQKTFNVTLQEDAQALDEVVVVAVGYGDVKRRDLTGAIGKANMSDLTKTPINNVAETLGGRIAGVQVSSTDGGLGDNFNIVIRGAGSLTQSTAPLYVIDVFPSETSGMSALNPNDIESIDVLKDASATAIYGSRGANGVVIITTKKGKAGKATLSYNGSVSVSKVRNTMDMMNGYDFVNLQKEIMEGNTKEVDGEKVDEFAYYYLKDGITLDDYKNFKSYDWQDEVYRTAISHNHYVGLSGGSDKMDYSASLSYSNQQGVIINSDLSRYQGRFNFNQRINKSIKINANANFASNVQNGPNPSTAETTVSNSLMYSVWGYRPVSPSGSDLLAELYDSDVDMSNDYRFNPVLSAKNEFRRTTTNHLQANLGVEWEIIKNLKFKTTAGYTGRDIKREEFNGSQTSTGNTHPSNTRSKGINAFLRQQETRNYLNENTLSYVYAKNNHNLNALVGATFQKYTSYLSSITQEQITNEAFGMSGIGKGSATPVVTASQGENAMISYLGRINYNYASKYYVTASMRTDGSSKFASGHRFGYFPSVSAGWTLTNEAFMESTREWLDFLKLRVSWGQVGNQNIDNYQYTAPIKSSTTNYLFGTGLGSANHVWGAYPSRLANENVKWETSEQYNIGIDARFLNGCLGMNADFYIKTTKDWLVQAPILATAGTGAPYINGGDVKNTGIELALTWNDEIGKDFHYNIGVNGTYNKNKVGNIPTEDGIIHGNTNQLYDNSPEFYRASNGHAIGYFWGYKTAGIFQNQQEIDDWIAAKNGVLQSDVKPGDVKFVDVDHNGIIDDNDKVDLGNGMPDFTYGFNLGFDYKGFDFSLNANGSVGNKIVQSYRNHTNKKSNYTTAILNRWTGEGTSNRIPRVTDTNVNWQFSDLYIQDGDFLRISAITLGYDFSRLWKGKVISQCRAYIQVQNALTFTKYDGMDPEIGFGPEDSNKKSWVSGIDYGYYPRPRTVLFGVNLKF